MKKSGFTPVTGQKMMRELKLGLNLWGFFSYKKEWQPHLNGLEFELPNQKTKASKKHFEEIAAKGFNFARLQICWTPHMDSNNIINNAWLNRIEETVNYALDAGLYIIINAYNGPDEKDEGTISYDEVFPYLSAVWEQTSRRFKDYSEYVIFDLMNEPRGENWDVGQEASAAVNRLNADVIKIIRESGGYNEKRIVLLPTAGASAYNALQYFTFPDDAYCMANIHSYTPWWFCLGEEAGPYEKRDSSHAVFGVEADKQVGELFSILENELTAKGIPFVMGETGAVNKNNMPERLKWVEAYISKGAKIGMPIAIHNDDASYKLFDYETLQWVDEEYLNKIFTVYKMND